MRLKFWGTRGSIPTPLRPAEVEEKLCQAILALPEDLAWHDETAVRAGIARLPPLVRGTAGGNTPCVELRAGGHTFVLDAGTGLREMGNALLHGPFGRGAGTLHLFISHLHWDHLQGFPMFKPAFIPGNHIIIYGVHDVRTAFTLQQEAAYWPVSLAEMGAQIDFVTLTEGLPVWIGPVRVDLLRNIHRGDAYSFRFTEGQTSVVYNSDAEYKDLDSASLQPFVEFFRHADALIFDAAYPLRDAWEKVDWGHSAALIGVDLARAAGVKRLFLFHHDPAYSDAQLIQFQETASAYQAQDPYHPPCEILVAWEGLEVNLTPDEGNNLPRDFRAERPILTPVQVFDELVVARLTEQLTINPQQPILDLSHVELLTTAGLQALVRWQKDHRHTPLILVAPSKRIRQVIQLAGYQDSFVIYTTLAEAWAALRSRQAAHLPGQTLHNRYWLEEWLAEDWLGVTFRALDLQQQQPVLLHILPPAFSPETGHTLLQQSRRLLTLDHPHVLKILDWNMDQGIIYEVKTFITGPTLEERLTPGTAPLADEQALEIAAQLAEALEYIHSHGLIHGMLNPAYIHLTAAGVQLNGLGLSPLIEDRVLLNAPQLYIRAAYLAPEQILGQPIDPRTDLYALGVILYQMLTGRLPFEGDEQAIMEAHLAQSPPPPTTWRPQLSPALEQLILGLLAKRPDDRTLTDPVGQRVLLTATTVRQILRTTDHRPPAIPRSSQRSGISSHSSQKKHSHYQPVEVKPCEYQPE